MHRSIFKVRVGVVSGLGQATQGLSTTFPNVVGSVSERMGEVESMIFCVTSEKLPRLYFGGSDSAKSTPCSTHSYRSLSDSQPSATTITQPLFTLPVMSNGSVWGILMPHACRSGPMRIVYATGHVALHHKPDAAEHLFCDQLRCLQFVQHVLNALFQALIISHGIILF